MKNLPGLLTGEVFSVCAVVLTLISCYTEQKNGKAVPL